MQYERDAHPVSFRGGSDAHPKPIQRGGCAPSLYAVVVVGFVEGPAKLRVMCCHVAKEQKASMARTRDSSSIKVYPEDAGRSDVQRPSKSNSAHFRVSADDWGCHLHRR